MENEIIKALSGEEITPIQTSTTTNPNDIHMNQPENGGKAAENQEEGIIHGLLVKDESVRRMLNISSFLVYQGISNAMKEYAQSQLTAMQEELESLRVENKELKEKADKYDQSRQGMVNNG